MVIPLHRADCLRVTHPCATLLRVAPFRVRLACVKRAANVRSEPGSNSPVKTVSIDPASLERLAVGSRSDVGLSTDGTRPFALARLRFSFQRPMQSRTESGAEQPSGGLGLGQSFSAPRDQAPGVWSTDGVRRSWEAQCTQGPAGVKAFLFLICNSFAPGGGARPGRGPQDSGEMRASLRKAAGSRPGRRAAGRVGGRPRGAGAGDRAPRCRRRAR